MAKKSNQKKGGMVSTKKWVEPEESQAEAVGADEEAQPDPAPAVEAPKPGKLTMDQAIEKFKKNPREVRFWCPLRKGQSIAKGDHFIQFKDHWFKTSDPAEVEIIMRSTESNIKYNHDIYAEDPELRNLKTVK